MCLRMSSILLIHMGSSGCKDCVRAEDMKAVVPIIFRKGRLRQVSSMNMSEEKLNSNLINIVY